MYAGGLRARLIKDSVYNMVHDSLEQLGWFDEDRHHRPVQVIPEPLANDIEIVPNLVSVDADTTNLSDTEMGSNRSEKRWTYWIDVYAESASLGTHLATDIVDILNGNYVAAGRTAPVVHVWDYQLATPVVIFACEIEDIIMERVRNAPKPFQKNWWAITFDVIDEYLNEAEA